MLDYEAVAVKGLQEKLNHVICRFLHIFRISDNDTSTDLETATYIIMTTDIVALCLYGRQRKRED